MEHISARKAENISCETNPKVIIDDLATLAAVMMMIINDHN